MSTVIGRGADMGVFAEAGSYASISNPGQIHGPIDTVIWWDFSPLAMHSRRFPWSAEEAAALAAMGVDMDDPGRERDMHARAWAQPTLFARRRAIFVTADRDHGQSLPLHPFWEDIAHALNMDSEKALAVLGVQTEALLATSEVNCWGRTIPLETLAPRELPNPSWRVPIPKGTVKPREFESPSGMEALLRCPLAWALRYSFKVRPGQAASLPEGGQLLGAFCHTMVKEMLAERADWTPEDAASWVDACFEDRLAKHAAQLLQPDRGTDREQLRDALRKAVCGLFQRIAIGKLTVQASELQVERSDKEQTFAGRIDLLLHDANDAPVVWDLKWSSTSKYLRASMEGDTALQLAAYCWMVQRNEAPPQAAYFLLQQNELISTATAWLPPEEMSATDLAEVWRRAEQAYRERLAAAGQGELFAEGMRPEELKSVDPETGYLLESKCKFCDYVNLCGGNNA